MRKKEVKFDKVTGEIETAPADKGASGQTDFVELATPTMSGDVRDFLLNRLRTMRKPYEAMSEDQQNDLIHECQEAALHLIKQVVVLVASEGRKAIVGNLLQVTRKDTIKAVVEFAKTDALRHELFDAQGTAVLLVVADPSAFIGQKADAAGNPDQADLGLPDEENEED